MSIDCSRQQTELSLAGRASVLEQVLPLVRERRDLAHGVDRAEHVRDVRDGDEARTPLTPADIVADAKPTVAWAMRS